MMSPVGAVGAEGVDGPGARDGFSAVAEPLRDEILLTSADGNALVVDNQGIAACTTSTYSSESCTCGAERSVVSRQVQKAIWLASTPSKT